MRSLLRWLGIVVVTVAITIAALGLLGYWFGRELLRTPVAASWEGEAGEVHFDLAPQTPFPKILAQLVRAKLISREQAVALRLYVRFSKRDAALIKAGEYLLRPSQSPFEILGVLSQGSVVLHRVTIVEGKNVFEIAQAVEEAGIASAREILAAALSSELASASGLRAESFEGYLFPETYYLPRGMSAHRILEVFVARFRDVWSRENLDALAKKAGGLTQHEVVTMASIIEKEAGVADERTLISAVIHNRLKRKMKLEMDPTVIYGIYLARGFFNGNLTRPDLRAPFPHSTYAHAGLPPGPIASPGLASLQAALSPRSSRALFFVARGDGSHEFCETLVCHNAAVGTYQLARVSP